MNFNSIERIVTRLESSRHEVRQALELARAEYGKLPEGPERTPRIIRDEGMVCTFVPYRDDPEFKGYVDELLKDEPPQGDPWPALTNAQRVYLARYEDKGNHIEAALHFCHPDTHFAWMRTCPAYRVAFMDVRSLSKDQLITHAISVSLHGLAIPLRRNGESGDSEPEPPPFEFRRNNDLLFTLIRYLTRLNRPWHSAPHPLQAVS